MRAHALLLALEAFLKKEFAEFSLPSPNAGMAPPQLFMGDLPDTDAEELPDRFPFVIIRWSKGEGREEFCQELETVAFILGVYGTRDKREAELTTVALMDHLRLAFRRVRQLENTFDLVLPVLGLKPDPEKKQHLYHIASLSTQWNYAVPDVPLPYDYVTNPAGMAWPGNQGEEHV